MQPSQQPPTAPSPQVSLPTQSRCPRPGWGAVSGRPSCPGRAPAATLHWPCRGSSTGHCSSSLEGPAQAGPPHRLKKRIAQQPTPVPDVLGLPCRLCQPHGLVHQGAGSERNDLAQLGLPLHSQRRHRGDHWGGRPGAQARPPARLPRPPTVFVRERGERGLDGLGRAVILDARRRPQAQAGECKSSPVVSGALRLRCNGQIPLRSPLRSPLRFPLFLQGLPHQL